MTTPNLSLLAAASRSEELIYRIEIAFRLNHLVMTTPDILTVVTECAGSITERPDGLVDTTTITDEEIMAVVESINSGAAPEELAE